MKRVGRWLFNFAAGISLMLCAGMAILWVRSYWIADSVSSHNSSGLFQLTILDQGQLQITVLSLDSGPFVPQLATITHATPGRTRHAPSMSSRLHGWLWHGFGLTWSTPAVNLTANGTPIGALQKTLASLKQAQAPTTQQLQQIHALQTRIQQMGTERATPRHVATLFISAWLVVLLAGILPGLWLRGFLTRTRHVTAGLCAMCGYDLRATPDRCPECGMAVERPQTTEGTSP